MDPFGGFSHSTVNFVSPVHESDKLQIHIDVPRLVNTALLQHVQICVWFWSHQYMSVVLGMFLLSAHRAEFEVQRDDDK